MEPKIADEKNDLDAVVDFLKQELKAGRVKFAPGLRVVDDIMKVKYGTDGKVDPSSVEPTVRALAYGLAGARNQEELMKVPLIEAQAAYFDFLDVFFSNPYSEMRKHDLTPHQVAVGLSQTDSLVKSFAGEFEELQTGIEQFWRTYAPVVEAHLAKAETLKAVFGGDISPSTDTNIVASSAVYVDTVVLPDPVLRITFSLPTMSPSNLVYYVSKHALNMMRYREFALADVEPPLVVVAAEQSCLDHEVMEQLAKAGEIDLLEHSSRMFGRTFDSTEELRAFFARIGTPDELVAVLAEPNLLLFDTEWDGSVADQIERFRTEILDQVAPDIELGGTGELVNAALIGRMMQSNDILGYSSAFSGSPLVDAPTSWRYLMWKYEYDQKRSQEISPETTSTFITKALQVAGEESFPLVGDLPLKALIELRRQGVMEEFRSVIRSGVKEVDKAGDDAFEETVDQVVANLEAALASHQSEIDDLKTSAKKLVGFDVVPAIGAGGLAIAALSTGNLALAYGAMFSGIAGVPSLRDLYAKGKNLVDQVGKTRRSPMGILLKHGS